MTDKKESNVRPVPFAAQDQEAIVAAIIARKQRIDEQALRYWLNPLNGGEE